MKVKLLSRVRLLVTPWTAAYQGPPSMRFSRQEYWSGVPLLLSYKKEHIQVHPDEIDEPRTFYTEVSQKEKEKHHILTHIFGI